VIVLTKYDLYLFTDTPAEPEISALVQEAQGAIKSINERLAPPATLADPFGLESFGNYVVSEMRMMKDAANIRALKRDIILLISRGQSAED
jgi:hypothetical protein